MTAEKAPEVVRLSRPELDRVLLVRGLAHMAALFGAPTMVAMWLGGAPWKVLIPVAVVVLTAAYLAVRASRFLRAVRRNTREHDEQKARMPK